MPKETLFIDLLHINQVRIQTVIVTRSSKSIPLYFV